MYNLNIKHTLAIALALMFLSPSVFAQALTADTDQKSYVPKDLLVVTGKTFPQDAILATLSNPQGRQVLTPQQIDVGADGSFSKIIMRWPEEPTEDLPFGTYTLKITSSASKQSLFLVFRFDKVATPNGVGEERRLELTVSVPPSIGREETGKIIVEVSLNGALVKGGVDTLRGSRIYYPDGSVLPITNFTVIDDGIYVADFKSEQIGHHIIHIQAFSQGLLANNAVGVFVEEGAILSLGKEIGKVNDNLEKLRDETIKRNDELASAVTQTSNAAGQVTSLLLPVIGLIVIILALQVTLLSRRPRIEHTPEK